MTRSIALFTATLLGASATLTGAATFKITPEKSKVTFTIMNKPPRASSFEEVPGSFKDFSGTWVMDQADPASSSVKMEVKTASVDTNNEKRDDHLRNQDFFKVKEFPTMTFQSRRFRKTGEDTYEVDGVFTLLGKSKPITATFKMDGDRSGQANFQLKRSDYGMTYRVPDTADEVDVTLEIVGEK